MALLATALLVGAASGAFAAPLNFASYDIYTPSGSSSDQQSSATTPVSVTSSPGSSSAAASADFGVLKAKGQASSAANTSGWGQTYGDASTSFQISVGAATPPPGGGGSGVVFSNLDPVNLSMTFRIDGTLSAGSDPNAGASTNSSLGSAGVSANLSIIDHSIMLDCGSPDGCYTPRLLDFGMHAYVESSDRGAAYSPDNYSSWNWAVNTVDELGIQTGSQSDSGANYSSSNLSFDTGILTATVSTHIGAVLDISGWISLLAQSYIGGTSAIDFYNTMGLVFTAPEGVLLGYGDITPAAYDFGGVSAVPLPAAVWLFGVGLAGLAGAVRRKTRA
jgi:hypothetical protein